MKSFNNKRLMVFFCIMFFASWIVGCKKLIEVNPPITSTNVANVYQSDATAASVLTGIYARLSANNMSFNEDLPSLFLYAGLSSDEIELSTITNTRYLSYYRNQLNSTPNTSFWSSIYQIIYYANSAIDGLVSSNLITPNVKKQLLGEAKFIRAFCYFYLSNLYGDVPLITTTDWKENSVISRTSKAEVWQQIISDLKDAQDNLNQNYVEADVATTKNTTERIRPNRWVATALLARVYLFLNEWAKAETEATSIINNVNIYDTVSINKGVFNKNSKEAIWQIQATGTGTRSNTGEGFIFVLPSIGPGTLGYPVYLSNRVINDFELDDRRKLYWVNSVTPAQPGTITYYYPYKYKIGAVNSSSQEYTIVFRLAEQYLIRAEARAHQSNFHGSMEDLNVIRKRAGLPNTNANDKSSLISNIMQERRIELFAEWGHRWFDLKRMGIVDAIMTPVAVQKGGIWNTHKQWFPIPLSELQKNSNLIQNTGY